MSKLDRKVALVTGAGRGIGQAIAIKLASEGARVVINDLDAVPAEETATRIRSAGGEAAMCVGSVVSADFPQRFIDTALESFGGIDIIVNNAGYTWDNVIQKMSDEQWHAILDVHLGAPFRILRAASEFIRSAAKRESQAGSLVHRKVVNISSVSGLYGNAGQANYGAAKAGITGFTKSMAKEWGRYNVNVNCVAFGYIMTRLSQPLTSEAAHIEVDGRQIKIGVQPEAIDALRRLVPLGRLGTPEEAAGSVFLFCIPESDYITGQVLVCGGGY